MRVRSEYDKKYDEDKAKILAKQKLYTKGFYVEK